jgi:hypothetical protein
LYIQKLAQFVGDMLPAFLTDDLAAAKLKTPLKKSISLLHIVHL